MIILINLDLLQSPNSYEYVNKRGLSILWLIREGRDYYKNEFIKFLIYALASSDETVVHLDFVAQCNYLSNEQHKGYTDRYSILGKKINKYLQYVMKSHLSPKDKKRSEIRILENLEPDFTQDE